MNKEKVYIWVKIIKRQGIKVQVENQEICIILWTKYET